jgi:carbon monoxide dehydrogenase subunit G
MKLQGVVTVPATQQQVWNLFLDPLQLCKVIPGCEKAQKLDETHYEAVLAVKVQFMTIHSKATGSILNAEEPRLLVGELIGEPLAMAGAFRARVTLQLEPASEAEATAIHYAMDLTMLGRLASLGEAIVRTTSQKLTREFAENVSQLFAAPR